MGTLHAPTSQVSVCAVADCCHSKLHRPWLSSVRFTLVCHCQAFLSLHAGFWPFIIHLFLSFISLSFLRSTVIYMHSWPWAYVQYIQYLWIVCVCVSVCLRSSGKRGSTGPRPVHPLSRSLQKLLRPRRMSVPQYPGPALLQVYTHKHSNT